MYSPGEVIDGIDKVAGIRLIQTTIREGRYIEDGGHVVTEKEMAALDKKDRSTYAKDLKSKERV